MGRSPLARTTAAIVTVVLLAGPVAAEADETRLIFTLSPGTSGSPFGMEVASSGSRPAIPSLTLTGGPSKTELTGWSLPLPVFQLRGVKFAPRYGNQQLALAFQPSELPGMRVEARRMRGVAVTATGRTFSGTILAGRAGNSRSVNPLEPAVPHLIGFSGTVTPRANLVFMPRFVAPLRKQSGIDTALGVGMRAKVAPHLTAIADVGTTRTASDRWTPMGTAALSGSWNVTDFEAGGSYAGRGTTLIGAVPFAASHRQFSRVRLRLGKGVTTEGQLARVGSLVAPDRTLSSSGSVHFERLPGGSMRLRFDRARMQTKDSQDTTIEWRARRSGRIGVQFRQQHERRRYTEELTRRLQIELPDIRGAHGLRMGVSSSMRLDGRSGEPRAGMRITSGIAPGRVRVSTEAEVDALAAGSPVRLGRLVTRTEVPLGQKASVQIGHTYRPGDRATHWRRIEIRVMHSFAL